MKRKPWARRVLTASAAVAVAVVTGIGTTSAGARATADPGIDTGTKTVTVGGWQIATGPNASFVATTNAVKALFEYWNTRGGVNGWKIKYVAPETGGDPARSLQEIRNQIEGNQIFAVVWGPGSPANQQVVPYVAQSGVPYVPPGESGDPYVGKTYKNIFPTIPPYSAQAIFMAEWAIKNLKAKRIALAYEADAVGQPVKDKFRAYLKKSHPTVKVVAEAAYQITDTDLSAVGRVLAQSKPDVVVNWGTAGPTVKSKQAAMAAGLNVPWFAPYFLADPGVIKLDPTTMDGVYFNYYARPFYSKDKYVQAFLNAMKRYQPNTIAGGLALNGWAGASVFIEALKLITAKNAVPTRANLIKALNTFDNKKIGVLPGVTYTPTAKSGASSSFLIRYKDGSFRTVGNAQTLPKVG